MTTEAVRVEQVKLNKETVTDRETVGGEVRKEQIEFDGDTTYRVHNPLVTNGCVAGAAGETATTVGEASGAFMSHGCG